jgi:ribose transport system permease protein
MKLNSFKRILSITEVNRTIFIIVLSFVIYIANPFFYTGPNLKLIATWGSIYALMIVGQMLYLIPGGIDLSLGGVICITNVLAAVFIIRFGMPIWLSVLIVLVIGALIGFSTALFANTFSPPLRYIVPVFIYTIMLSFVLTGIARIITRAFPIYGFPDSYSFIGKAKIGPLPITFVYLLIILVIFIFIFYFRSIGWHFFATGLNDEVARKVGINVKKTRIIAFTLGSLIQAFVGVIIGSYLAVGSVLIGPSYLLPILAGAFIGGISIAGGEGSPYGAALGGFAVYLIENIIVVLAVSAFWKEVAIGLFLFFFVLFDFLQKRGMVFSKFSAKTLK